MRRRLKLAAGVVGLVGLIATAGFASNTFTDVPAGRYYTDAVDWAFNNGVTTGTSATTFSPEQAVTRAQNVTFAYRYDQNIVQPALDNIDNQLDDVDNRIDGLDTLDELSCTPSQVAINDNGWRCADPVLTRSFTGAFNYTFEDTDSVGWDSSLAIGADGKPVISHHAFTTKDLELFVCDNPTCTSGTNRTLVTADNVGYYTSVAIGADGNPIISHQDQTNGDLELYVCDNPTCTSGTNQTLQTTGDVGWYTSVAIGADGNPIISHYDLDLDNQDLELYVCANPTCTTGTNQTLVIAEALDFGTSIAIGTNGNPVISYHDNNDRDLVLYVCANPTCTTGTNRPLVTDGSAGYYSSIAIDTDGNPIISHHDQTNRDLELYVCADTTCTAGTNQTLVTTDSVGYNISIAIGLDGNPIISHRDATNGDLEVAVPVFTVTGIAFD